MSIEDLLALLVFILVISALLIYLAKYMLIKKKSIYTDQATGPHLTMIDDSRVKRVLKGYPKGSTRFDKYIDLNNIPIADLRAALRSSPDDKDVKPHQLDDYAIDYFSKIWPQAFDMSQYDYFIHIYLKPEYRSLLNEKSDIVHNLPSEDGPPESIPHPEGARWISVRPSENGYENYMALYEDEI